MALWAIADLHLSLGADKPMDVFSGWLLGEVAFDLCKSKTVTKPFYRLFDREKVTM